MTIVHLENAMNFHKRRAEWHNERREACKIEWEQRMVWSFDQDIEIDRLRRRVQQLEKKVGKKK